MSFDWFSYLTLAEYMRDKVDEFPNQEATYRSVISRAYYAAFCMTRNYVREVDNTEFHGDDHKVLQNYLKHHPHKTRKKLGSQLQDLHQHRIKADYHDNLDELAGNKASRAVILAKRIVETIAQLL